MLPLIHLYGTQTISFQVVELDTHARESVKREPHCEVVNSSISKRDMEEVWDLDSNQLENFHSNQKKDVITVLKKPVYDHHVTIFV